MHRHNSSLFSQNDIFNPKKKINRNFLKIIIFFCFFFSLFLFSLFLFFFFPRSFLILSSFSLFKNFFIIIIFNINSIL